MAGGRGKNGRGRAKGKRQREASSDEQTWISQESSKDEDFVPFRGFSRFPTRIPRERSAKSAALRSLIRNAITKKNHKSSRRNLETIAISYEETINGDNVMPRGDNLFSNAPVELPRSKSGDSRPIRNDSNTETLIIVKTVTAISLDNCTDPISEPEVATLHQKNYVDTQDPTTFIVNGIHTHCLNGANSNTSVDITEFAKRFHDNDDVDEVESTPNPGLEDVWGHKVKPAFAPLLRRIFNKHGDIAAQTGFKSPNTLSSYLQQLCYVCEHLERTKFLQIKQAELKSMVTSVGDFERAKLDVRWLRERVEHVYRAWNGYQKYRSLKEELGKYDVSILSMEKKLDAYKTQLSHLQRKIVDVERELEAKQAEAGRMRNVVLDIRARVKTLVKGTLVDGLY